MGGILDSSENVLQREIKSNYEVIEKLEDTSLSVVLKAKEKKTNTLVAIRVYITKYLERIYGSDKLEFAKSNIRNEIEYLNICDGDYSLHIIQVLEHPDCFNIVTESWDTTLEKHVINLGGALTIKEIKEIYSKLNIGFREMYNNDIIHGDLTLKNILVKYKEDDSIIPKITGYGRKIIFNEKLGLMHSETHYAAPEVLRGEKYTYKIDLWSLGVMLYRLYFGEVPYKGKTQVAIYNQIMSQAPIKKKGKNDLFDDLISKLLQINPNLRMDWEEYFAHDFWKVKDPEEDSESEENEINDENINNALNSSSKKNNYNDEINEKDIEDELKKKKEEENKNNKLKYNIFYSFYKEENVVEVNPFVISQNLEEFPITTKNRLKKMEVYLNKEDLKDDNNPANPTQENEMKNNTKPLKSDLLLRDLIKKIKNKYLYKLILYGCRLNEIEALSNSAFENLTELDLSNNLLDNLEIFIKSSFRNLISLNLNHNKISNIDSFIQTNFKSLTNLSLTNNKISNLEALAKVPFISLEKLNLSSNLIYDLEIFKNVPFNNLTYLNISDNKIRDNKSSLSDINLPNLRIFDLSHNNISDISGLTSRQYQQLTMLNLGKNSISNIEILARVPFTELKILILYDNKISDINVFNVAPFSNLSYLNLSYNDISDITVLTNVPFNNLSKLDLSGNAISNIDPLLRMPINDMREFYIKNNKIEKNMFNKNVFEELKKKYKHIVIN